MQNSTSLNGVLCFLLINKINRVISKADNILDLLNFNDNQANRYCFLGGKNTFYIRILDLSLMRMAYVMCVPA